MHTNSKKIWKSWISLIIKEIQIETTMKYYFMPVWMASVKQTENNNYWGKCGRKESLYTVGGNVYEDEHYGKQYRNSSNIKNLTTVWSRISFSDIHLKAVQFVSQILVFLYLSSIFATAKKWKHLKLDKWINKS